jgi:hypothetical protein
MAALVMAYESAPDFAGAAVEARADAGTGPVVA